MFVCGLSTYELRIDHCKHAERGHGLFLHDNLQQCMCLSTINQLSWHHLGLYFTHVSRNNRSELPFLDHGSHGLCIAYLDTWLSVSIMMRRKRMRVRVSHRTSSDLFRFVHTIPAESQGHWSTSDQYCLRPGWDLSRKLTPLAILWFTRIGVSFSLHPYTVRARSVAIWRVSTVGRHGWSKTELNWHEKWGIDLGLALERANENVLENWYVRVLGE